MSSIIDQLLLAEKDPKLFFGPNPDEVLKHWHKLCHPDRLENKELAQEYFTRFTIAYESLKVKPVKILLKGKEYVLAGKPIVGDTSDVYISDVVVKVGRLNDLSMKFSQNEVESLCKIVDPHFRKYVPDLIDSHKQVNVFSLRPEFTRLSELSNVQGVHVAWITKRLLEILGYVHKLGLTHGGITPDNILIFKKTHGINLLDWKFAGLKEVKKSKKYLDIYPEHGTIGPEADIFMALKSVQKISGDIPTPLKNFFKGSLLPKLSMCPNNAWALRDEFDEMLLKTFGRPKFVEMS